MLYEDKKLEAIFWDENVFVMMPWVSAMRSNFLNSMPKIPFCEPTRTYCPWKSIFQFFTNLSKVITNRVYVCVEKFYLKFPLKWYHHMWSNFEIYVRDTIEMPQYKMVLFQTSYLKQQFLPHDKSKSLKICWNIE